MFRQYPQFGIVNGVASQMTEAQVKAEYTATATPTQDFEFVYNSQTLRFYKDQPVPVTIDLATALNAAGAPVTEIGFPT